MNVHLQDFRIAAVSVVTGQHAIALDDELAEYGGDRARIERLKKATGLHTRRVVAEGTTAVDLAEVAVRDLVDAGLLGGEGPDACLFVTQTPDHFQPANAAILHGRFGWPRSVACADLNLGCSGWVYALVHAGALIQSGCARRILVIAGDTLSRQIDPSDRATVPLFGDGASATLLEFEEGREFRAVLGTDGSGRAAIQIPAGGLRRPPDRAGVILDSEGNPHREDCLLMDGAEVFKFTLREVPGAVEALLGEAGIGADAIAYFFFHQANAYILSNLRRRMKVDSGRMPVDTLARYGNLSSASIPAVLCDTLAGGTQAPADLLPAVFCGFGVGLSWGAALTDVSGVHCLPVKAYGQD